MAKFDMEAIISGGKVSNLDTSGTTVEHLPLGKLSGNPKNFYNARDGIAELEDSIEANGLLEPLLVRPEGDGYIIISGHRRFNALSSMSKRGVVFDFDAIDCIVDRSPMTAAQEMTKLIEANRQRVKTPSEIASEAQHLTESYVERKKGGEHLPGKIRDMVAKDMELSASKLARLHVIKNGLTLPGFVLAFEQNKMPESVAYEIAKLPSAEQYRVLDLSIERGEEVGLSLLNRYNFIKTKHTICDKCDGDHPCNIGNIIYDHYYLYGNMTNCAGCCKQCTRQANCAYACDVSRPDSSAGLAEDALPDGEELDGEPELSEIFCARLKAARKAAQLEKKELAKLVGAYDITYSSWENSSLPGTGWIPPLAKALKVSTDYLLGLTDKPDPSAAPEGGQDDG